jgi:hypothetical protein
MVTTLIERLELQRIALIDRLKAAPRQHKAAWQKALQDHTTKMLEAENSK